MDMDELAQAWNLDGDFDSSSDGEAKGKLDEDYPGDIEFGDDDDEDEDEDDGEYEEDGEDEIDDEEGGEDEEDGEDEEADMDVDEDNEVIEDGTRDLIGEEKEVGSDQNEIKLDQDINDTD